MIKIITLKNGLDSSDTQQFYYASHAYVHVLVKSDLYIPVTLVNNRKARLDKYICLAGIYKIAVK